MSADLVIVAGGLGSRLAPLTNNIPKLFVNIGKNTGYVEIVRYWAQQLELLPIVDDRLLYTAEDLAHFAALQSTITVIVHSSYAALVGEYHRLYFPEIPLIIKTVDEAAGSAHAILSTCEHLIGRSVLFTWCDVLPTEPIPVAELPELYGGLNVVFTNYNSSNRYGLRKPGKGAHLEPYLDPDERGGCFGLYYISSFNTLPTYERGQDFIEIIQQYGPLREHRLESIVDFGDLPKLRRVQAKADEAREFNSIELVGEYVLKQAMNEQGRKILKKEVAWYQHLETLLKPGETRPAVPRAWIATDGGGFFMSRVQGVPLWRAWPELSPVDRAHVLQQLITQRQQLFNLQRLQVGVQTILADVRQEAHTKLLDRYHEIEGMIQAFGKVTHVNQRALRELDPKKTIHRLHAALEAHYMNHSNTEYGFVHGDLQFSNSMVDLDTMRVKIIDPRGYFGHSLLTGLEDYDIGKLLYALSGYDTFNSSREFFITRRDTELLFDIPEPSHVGVETIVAEHFKPVHHLWLAVCWIGLAAYIKNDPVKSVAAHYHGLALAERVLLQL